MAFAKAIAEIHLDPLDPGLLSLDLSLDLCFVVDPLTLRLDDDNYF